MISMVFAVGENYELGCNNKLLWHLKNDLINFKKLTLNKTIIMGRKTFESLGRLLPNRKHIVISNNYKTDLEDIEITNDVKEIINRYENSEEEVFIIGGASIYKLFEEYAVTYKDRNGGYTRIIKLKERIGDDALIVRLELV